MGKDLILRLSCLLLIITTLMLAACGGGETPTVGVDNGNEGPVVEEGGEDTEEEVMDATNGNGEVDEGEEPPAAPEGEIPDILVVHPEAFDLKASPASNTYVFIVPMMVAETSEYMLTNLEEKGWATVGQPTVMGHLATLNMQQEGYRLTISMQDNERTETTRVQMMLLEQ